MHPGRGAMDQWYLSRSRSRCESNDRVFVPLLRTPFIDAVFKFLLTLFFPQRPPQAPPSFLTVR